MLWNLSFKKPKWKYSNHLLSPRSAFHWCAGRKIDVITFFGVRRILRQSVSEMSGVSMCLSLDCALTHSLGGSGSSAVSYSHWLGWQDDEQTRVCAGDVRLSHDCRFVPLTIGNICEEDRSFWNALGCVSGVTSRVLRQSRDQICSKNGN